jgi:hypothetical protein
VHFSDATVSLRQGQAPAAANAASHAAFELNNERDIKDVTPTF